MRHIKPYNEAINPRISRSTKSYPYQLHLKYEHGDADFTSKETFNFKNDVDFDNACKFFYDCMNFVPKTAYGKLGYFYPIPDGVNNGTYKQDEAWDKLVKIGEKYGISEDQIYEYIPRDRHYGVGFACLEGIKATINGEEVVLVFKKALETNKISLPNLGDTINVNVMNIPGYGPSVFGGKYTDYMPNSGTKDYLKKTFPAKVIDCAINFHHNYENEHYTEYTHFSYILLLESPENVLKDNVAHYNGSKPLKLVYQMDGWDPQFETKFNKEKYDGMNFYEVE